MDSMSRVVTSAASLSPMRRMTQPSVFAGILRPRPSSLTVPSGWRSCRHFSGRPGSASIER